MPYIVGLIARIVSGAAHPPGRKKQWVYASGLRPPCAPFAQATQAGTSGGRPGEAAPDRPPAAFGGMGWVEAACAGRRSTGVEFDDTLGTSLPRGRCSRAFAARYARDVKTLGATHSPPKAARQLESNQPKW